MAMLPKERFVGRRTVDQLAKQKRFVLFIVPTIAYRGQLRL
jgi:hypothetical protein